MPAGFTYKILEDVDPTFFDKLRKRLSRLKREVVVGYPSPADLSSQVVGDKGVPTKEADGTTLAYIAKIHEFGVPESNIPERPFLRMTFRAHKAEYLEFNKKLVAKLVKEDIDIDKALGLLGNKVVGDIKQTIRNGQFAPDKAATIKRKGSSKPLIDTGQLMQGVTYVVRDK